MKTEILTKLQIVKKYINDVSDAIEMMDNDTDPSLEDQFEEILYELDSAFLSIVEVEKSMAPLLNFVCEDEEETSPSASEQQQIYYTPAVVIAGELAHLQYDVAESYAKYHQTVVRNEKGYILADYR